MKAEDNYGLLSNYSSSMVAQQGKWCVVLAPVEFDNHCCYSQCCSTRVWEKRLWSLI